MHLVQLSLTDSLISTLEASDLAPFDLLRTDIKQNLSMFTQPSEPNELNPFNITFTLNT